MNTTLMLCLFRVNTMLHYTYYSRGTQQLLYKNIFFFSRTIKYMFDESDTSKEIQLYLN